jgi:hypothetical protein
LVGLGGGEGRDFEYVTKSRCGIDNRRSVDLGDEYCFVRIAQ